MGVKVVIQRGLNIEMIPADTPCNIVEEKFGC
jgi:hypothetical protein